MWATQLHKASFKIVWAFSHLEYNLEETPFCIAIDGGVDKSGNPYLRLCIRYFATAERNEPQTKLLALIELEESHTGVMLYKKKHYFSANVQPI